AGGWCGYDETALTLADGRQHIHHKTRQVILSRLHLEARLRIKRRQVVEEDLVASFLRRLEVDRVDFDQREVTLAFLGGADLTADGIACAEIESANLRGRNVHVIRAGQIVVLGGAQEAETIGQAFEDAFGEDQTALFRLDLQDLEDEFLLTQTREALNTEILCDLVQLLDAHVFELDQIERTAVLALVALGAAAAVEQASAWDRRLLGP